MQSRPPDLPEQTPPAHELSDSSRSQAQAAQQQPLSGPSLPGPPFPRTPQQRPPPPPPPSSSSSALPLEPFQLQRRPQPDFATSSSATASTFKRRRSSFSSPAQDLKPAPVNVPATPARPTLLNPAPTIGGSTREITADMQRSSTPPDASGGGTIKYTRTGRVSKATKGQRVHHCDECGKTYTRAEHLRRHQQNHKPGAFPCDIPGCDRSFYREDLLNRHKARHNDPTSAQPSPTRSDFADNEGGGFPKPLPPGAQTPLPPPSAPPSAQPTQGRHPVQTTPPRSGGQQPDKPRVGRVPIPPYQLPLVADNIDRVVFGASYPGLLHPDDSSPTSPEAYYDSPRAAQDMPPYYSELQPPGRTRNESVASYSEYLTYNQHPATRSPASVDSCNTYHCYQPVASPQSVTLYWAENAVASQCVSGLYSYSLPCFMPPFPYESPETRDLEEQNLLNMSGSDPAADDNEQRYLLVYWNSIHPFFPVVHKPTFRSASTSPLLRSAMAALGGAALGNRDDLSNARMIHDRCQKVLKNRSARTHTYRVCDMQAIFLIEVYSIFRSRRPPFLFSGQFENIYEELVRDGHAWDHMPSPAGIGYSGGYADEHDSMSLQQIEAESKQRLLLCCYTLDQQHGALFGRPRLDLSKGIGRDLPFPNSQKQWDASDDSQVDLDERRGSTLSYCEHISDALLPVSNLHEPVVRPYDPFQSLVMMACLSDPTSDGARQGSIESETNPLIHAIDDAPYTRLAFHTFELCKETPVRDLLAVAGESWVMAEKLGSSAEYSRSQFNVGTWARAPQDVSAMSVHRALSHALSIMNIIREGHHRTGLFFQEWAVHLAALVIWARQYVLTDDSRQPSSPSTPPAAALSSAQLDQRMRSLLLNGVEALSNWNNVRIVLMWTKQNTEAMEMLHTCGLISGALDVLSKLINRGNEEGWF